MPAALPPCFRQAASTMQLDASVQMQDDLDAVIHEACRVAAEGVGAGLAVVLQYRADHDALVLQAGIGWPAHMVGWAYIAASLRTTTGLAWLTGQLIHFRHLDRVHRTQVPEAMQGRGACRMVSVPIQGESHAPFGVLEVGSPDVGECAQHDLIFLRTVARSIAAAVDRHSGLMRWADHAAEALEHGRTSALDGWQQDVQIGTC